ncbi:hypothetical protein [Thiolapillus sp.]|uniref:hypothetical protein n=1 Tax=Thiolapillus sp. TaxID=2017437 RepID=UPI00263AE6C7|nr:hypothetical protein [Thiolapillus sp.]
MTRTAGAQIGCQRPIRFWGLGCPKIYHEGEDTLVTIAISGIPNGQGRLDAALDPSLTLHFIYEAP